MTSPPPLTRPSAAVLLIGNELLSGRVQDDNLAFLARELWSLGVPVLRAAVVRDDIADIAAAVRELAAEHTWVFTTGGIGPTHDDVSIAGVARAFGAGVSIHPQIEAVVREKWGAATTPAHLRLALVPDGGELEYDPPSQWPTVRMRNVYILPGVPVVLRLKFGRLKERFRQCPFHRRLIGFVAEEALLAAGLDRIAQSFAGRVEIGSYPEPDRVLVSVEGPEEAAVQAAAAEIEREFATLPRASV